VDGLRTNASNIKIEGVWASDVVFDMSPAAPNATVPLEAVGEYRVTTFSASAEDAGAPEPRSRWYKSGTNSFHGSVYEFNRNTSYNANNFFVNKQAPAGRSSCATSMAQAWAGRSSKTRHSFSEPGKASGRSREP
jgi:hypothetical protein